MKSIFKFLLIILLFSPLVLANEDGIIELHSKKSLDQLVLENNNQNSLTENENTEKNSEINIIEENKSSEDPDTEIIEFDNDVNQVQTNINNFWKNVSIVDLENYLLNINKINSPTLYNEFILHTNNFDLDYTEKKNRDIFFLISKKLFKSGEISKVYDLIKSRNIETDENFNFYKEIELNYLFSTYQLDEACELSNSLDNNIKFDNNFLKKIDIFCLILENKISEADLQNSILLDTEIKKDLYFQTLYSYLINIDSGTKQIQLPEITFQDLIFLYSAMIRIAELPFDDKFLNIDSKNLSIPVILNNATDMKVRINAAHKSFYDQLLSSQSLAALYQSVDFDSDQLNNIEETVNEYSSNKELLMAYFYQLVNVQIFPTERLEALIKFWNFAKDNNLEKIAHELSLQTIMVLEPSVESSKYGIEISSALISNLKYTEASKWIAYYENINKKDIRSTQLSMLLDLYQSNDINKFVDFIIENKDKFNESGNEIKEIIFILLEIFSDEDPNYLILSTNNIFDKREMISLSLRNEIKKSINDNDYEKFLFLILSSINNKNWNELHPEHLKIIISGFKVFENNDNTINIILEIFKNYKII